MIADRATTIDAYSSGDCSLKTADDLANALMEIQQLRADLQVLESQLLAEQQTRPALAEAELTPP